MLPAPAPGPPEECGLKRRYSAFDIVRQDSEHAIAGAVSVPACIAHALQNAPFADATWAFPDVEIIGLAHPQVILIRAEAVGPTVIVPICGLWVAHCVLLRSRRNAHLTRWRRCSRPMYLVSVDGSRPAESRQGSNVPHGPLQRPAVCRLERSFVPLRPLACHRSTGEPYTPEDLVSRPCLSLCKGLIAYLRPLQLFGMAYLRVRRPFWCCTTRS